MLSAGGVSYGYDANGSQKTHGSDTFPAGAPDRQSNGFAQGLQQYVGSIRLDRQAQPPLFYHEDAKGYTAALTNPAAAVQERYTYDAYGVIRFENAASVPTGASASTVANPFLFAGGQRYDPETELFTGRYYVVPTKHEYGSGGYTTTFAYKPDEGRYISRDDPGVIRWRSGSSGSVVRKIPGRTTYQPVTLEGGGIGDLDFWDWMSDIPSNSYASNNPASGGVYGGGGGGSPSGWSSPDGSSGNFGSGGGQVYRPADQGRQRRAAAGLPQLDVVGGVVATGGVLAQEDAELLQVRTLGRVTKGRVEAYVQQSIGYVDPRRPARIGRVGVVLEERHIRRLCQKYT